MCQSLMRAAMSQLNLSARAYHRIIKLARTMADLARWFASPAPCCTFELRRMGQAP
jgi:predicted ATPase with chaperone activity